MQKIFYCVYIRSDKEKLSTFIESMLSNIQSSVQKSNDDTASFMYLFDNTRNAVVGMYSAENTHKLPQAISMYVNSLNSEAQMMGAIFEDIDTSSKDFDRTQFIQMVSNTIPSALPGLTAILGTQDPNANKPSISASEPTEDIFAAVNVLPQDGTEEYSYTEPVDKPTPNREIKLLEEILDKITSVAETVADMAERISKIEDSLELNKKPLVPEEPSELTKEKAKEIESIGGIPEVPTYQEEESAPVTEPTPEKVVEPEVDDITNVEKLVDEAHKESINVGSEVATPSEVSLPDTRDTPNPEATQSLNGSSSTIVSRSMKPEVEGNTEDMQPENTQVASTESVDPIPEFNDPKLSAMYDLLKAAGTESGLDNYIISNSKTLPNSDLDLYCKYDFAESVKLNQLVELDRVTSIRHKLEIGRL